MRLERSTLEGGSGISEGYQLGHDSSTRAVDEQCSRPTESRRTPFFLLSLSRLYMIWIGYLKFNQ